MNVTYTVVRLSMSCASRLVIGHLYLLVRVYSSQIKIGNCSIRRLICFEPCSARSPDIVFLYPPIESGAILTHYLVIWRHPITMNPIHVLSTCAARKTRSTRRNSCWAKVFNIRKYPTNVTCAWCRRWRNKRIRKTTKKRH